MPLPTLSFRTTGVWGSGLGRNLTAPEVDTNFYNLGVAIEALQDSPPTANSIASITVNGRFMTIVLTDGSSLGPFPLPVLEFKWRGAWQPFTIFKEFDGFAVDGKGLYSVLIDHTAAATFDEALQIGGNDVYNKLFGADAGSAAIANMYDVEVFYQGKPGDSLETVIVDIASLRALSLPIGSGLHIASLLEAPSTATQVYPIYHDLTHIGDITFSIGSNVGVFFWLITTDEAITKGEHVQIHKAGTIDATASGLTIAFAMQRVT